MKNVLSILQERGFIENITSENLKELTERPLSLYAGFDPTADSLHLGNLVAIVLLGWFSRCGHKPIAIVGGATGMIGDPSGKSIERNLLDEASIEKNLLGIRHSLQSVLSSEVTILNNFDWFKKFSYIEFLREIGKHFRMGTMLAKDSVRSRLNSEEGLSYTEFSYQMLQAYDFLHLFDTQGVTLQIGGSDQWGNIVAGTELVRKVRNQSVYGLTYPLLTRSDGKKFGKSEEGAIWLNKDKLSPYDFYQYIFRIPDADIGKMFRMLTYKELSEIEEVEHAMQSSAYQVNSAQRLLAQTLTELVHGKEGLLSAEEITEAAKPGSKTLLDVHTMEQLAREIPCTEMRLEDVVGQKVADLFVFAGFQESKGEARRLIKNGGAYLNNEKISDGEHLILKSDCIAERFLLLGIGKKRKMIIRIEKKNENF